MTDKNNKYTHLTPRQENEVATLYKQGYPVSEIVKQFHISFWKVYNCLDKHNIPRTFIRPNSIRYNDFSHLTLGDIHNILEDVNSSKLTNDEISLKYNLRTEHTLREIKALESAGVYEDASKGLSGLDDVDYD